MTNHHHQLGHLHSCPFIDVSHMQQHKKGSMSLLPATAVQKCERMSSPYLEICPACVCTTVTPCLNVKGTAADDSPSAGSNAALPSFFTLGVLLPAILCSAADASDPGFVAATVASSLVLMTPAIAFTLCRETDPCFAGVRLCPSLTPGVRLAPGVSAATSLSGFACLRCDAVLGTAPACFAAGVNTSVCLLCAGVEIAGKVVGVRVATLSSA